MIKLDLTYLFAKRPGRLYIIAALFAIIGIMTLPRTIYGQTNTITVTGTVTDTTGSPLPGIAIAAVDQTGIGTATDLNGKFVLEVAAGTRRSEEHTSELQSLMRISYAVFCLQKNNKQTKPRHMNAKNRYK